MMPFSRIDSLEASRELVEGASARNGGIIFDLWHIVKLGIPYDSVARFPKQYFYGVEINDGYLKSPPGMDFREETTGHRKLCGMGEFDIKGFVQALREFAVPRAHWNRSALQGTAELAARQDRDHRLQHDSRPVQLAVSLGTRACDCVAAVRPQPDPFAREIPTRYVGRQPPRSFARAPPCVAGFRQASIECDRNTPVPMASWAAGLPRVAWTR